MKNLILAITLLTASFTAHSANVILQMEIVLGNVVVKVDKMAVLCSSLEHAKLFAVKASESLLNDDFEAAKETYRLLPQVGCKMLHKYRLGVVADSLGDVLQLKLDDGSLLWFVPKYPVN